MMDVSQKIQKGGNAPVGVRRVGNDSPFHCTRLTQMSAEFIDSTCYNDDIAAEYREFIYHQHH